MSKKRKQYSSNFKAKVARQSSREIRLLLSWQHAFRFTPTMVSTWKRELLERASELFANKSGNKSKSHQDEVDNLYRQIGQLSLERDFLARKLDH